MTHSYDSYGWLSLADIPGRTTEATPPTHIAAPIVGQPWPNWTGVEWAMLPYVDPHAAAQARLAGELHLHIAANKTTAAVAESVTVTATLKDGLGAVVPLSSGFSVPIEDSEGAVAMIKGVAFVGGQASVQIAFQRSGYFRITEAGINRKLTDMYIRLDAPFEITVYE